MFPSVSTLEFIISTCNNLAAAGAPCCAMSDDGVQEVGHWSATKSLMEEKLGRALLPQEITALSLGRYFGPTPLLLPDEAIAMNDSLFLHGNSYGGWYQSWDDLGSAIASFVK